MLYKMPSTIHNDPILTWLCQWGSERDSVHAILLDGSRANPRATVDAFSDYDVVLIVRDVNPWVSDKRWLADFGEVLVVYWDQVYPQPDTGLDCCSNVAQYADGLHIDFTLWPVDIIERLASTQTLPTALDSGYTVLLDKDNLVDQLPAPSYRAYIPVPPSETLFLKVIEDFLSDIPYVAKCLWRSELMPAKWCLEHDMKHNFLRPMLEWYTALAHNWTKPAGVLGCGFKATLPPAIWRQLEQTYTGADIEDNWNALFQTADLFYAVGTEIATYLGYRYPASQHQAVVNYARKVQATPR